MSENIVSLHVMPLLHGCEKQLAADALQLIQDRICTHIACIMTLVPEADPPDDKAAVLAERFEAFRNEFQGDKNKIGILIQATIGHGWTPDEPASFRKITRSNGSEAYQMCPLDKDFQAYVDRQIDRLAKLKPAFFLIDDDFRLVTGRNGCWCPLHIAEFNRRNHTDFTRETLFDAMKSGREDLIRAFDDLMLDSLKGLATVIRTAIDRHAPETPGGFCICAHDINHAEQIRAILAGNVNDKLIRINNARYLSQEMNSFAHRMYEGAAQIAGLDPDTTVLAETDTYPQNRWSTSAALLHAHYTGSILEGCDGAKHWITRTNTWEPEEGTAYRAILKKYAGFYEELHRVLRRAVPAPVAAAVLPGRIRLTDYTDPCRFPRTWNDVISNMGIPCMFVPDPEIPSMLTSEEIRILSDEQLERAAKHGLILDGSAAEALTQRGLEHLSGVSASLWDGPRVSGEIVAGDHAVGPMGHYSKIVCKASAEAHDVLFHRRTGTDTAFQKIGESVVFTKNVFGARVAVFAATYEGHPAFIRHPRKMQFLAAMEYVVGEKIAYLDTDAMAYCKEFRLEDDSCLFAVFNTSFDPMDSVPLILPFPASSFERLTPDGKWEPIPYDGKKAAVPLAPAEPVVFRIRK